MSDMMSEKPFPRGVLLAASLLLGFSMLSAGAARLTGVGTTAAPDSAPVESRALRFEDRADGGVVVLLNDAGAHREIDVLAPGTNGFVRSVLRGLVRERRARGIGSGPDFRLTRHADGRLSLQDPSTGRTVDLDAFGPTNVAAFGRLLRLPDGASDSEVVVAALLEAHLDAHRGSR